MNVLVAVPYLHDTVPGQRFRIEQWARLLERSGVSVHFEPFESPALRKVMYRQGHVAAKALEVARCIVSRVKWLATLDDKRWDAIVLHRELLPIGPPVLERWLARTGIPVVYDFDDAIFLSNVSDANRQFVWLKWPRKTGTICQLSNHVIVGNDYLGEYASRFNAPVTVVPTTIDSDAYMPRSSVALHDPPIVGWSGSLTTIKHLNTISAALRQLRNSVKYRLKVVGGDGFAVQGLDIECVPWTAATEISNLREFDVGIMPLPDDDWSRGKCGLKALQYMALGVPVVVSPVGVNSEIIIDGHNGFVAATDSEWVDKLSRLLTDSELRRRFAYEGRQTVERRYSAKVQAPRVLRVLEAACRGRRARFVEPSFTDVHRHADKP